MANQLLVKEGELLLAQTRKKASKFVTNFFCMPSELERWFERGIRVVTSSDRMVILARQEHACTRVFFSGCQTEISTILPVWLLELSRPCVIDLIGTVEGSTDLVEAFLRLGFMPHVRLARLTRKECNEVVEGESRYPSCQWSEMQDSKEIFDRLQEHFDFYADQIPSMQEVVRAVVEKQIRVVRLEQDLDGFLWFERKGLTALIRYWWVARAHRGVGLGGHLMRDYFRLTTGCLRHLLWVRENNHSAYQQYAHYGYATDGVQDNVMILWGEA